MSRTKTQTQISKVYLPPTTAMSSMTNPLPDVATINVKPAPKEFNMKIREQTASISADSTAEDVLAEILDSTISGQPSMIDRICLEIQPPFKGETSKDRLVYCISQQENSFWAMFYAEFWHMINFMISRSEQLFPSDRGFVWVDPTPSLPVRYMFSEDRSKGGSAYQRMANSVRRYIECILQVTPCILKPVGRQYLFMVNLVCIERATLALAKELSKPGSFLGTCHDTCGGRDTGNAGDEEAARYLKKMTSNKSRGGAGGGHPSMRDTTVHSWMAVRDMVINLNAIVADAMFVSTMFRSVCESVVGRVPGYEPDELDGAMKRDPVFGGYKLREKPTGIEVLDKNIPEFSFIEFAIHLACHTGEKVVHYMPPVYLYTHHKKQVSSKVDSEFYSRVWCSAFGMMDRYIVKNMMVRFQREWDEKHDEFPDTFEYVNPGVLRMTNNTAVQFRSLLNNSHHMTKKQYADAVHDFRLSLTPDTPRAGIDDYHRYDDVTRGTTMVINWMKHMVLVNDDEGDLLRGAIMRTAGCFIQDGVEEIVACEEAKRDLITMLEEEDLKRLASSKKKSKKAKRKARRAAKTLCKTTDHVESLVESPVEQPVVKPVEQPSVPAQAPVKAPAPSRMMMRIMQEGAATVIARWWKTFVCRRVIMRLPYAITIQRNVRAFLSNKRLGKFTSLVARFVGSFRTRKDLASYAISKWYRGVCKRYDSRFQLVVFDTQAYHDRLRLREFMLKCGIADFYTEVGRFNSHVQNMIMEQFLWGVMRQVEHYLVYAPDDFIYNNMCYKTSSVSVKLLSGFPRLARMIAGHPVDIIPAACVRSPTLKVVYNSAGKMAIHCPYLVQGQ